MLDGETLERVGDRGLREALCGGVDWIQLRERPCEGATLLAFASRIAAAIREVAPAAQLLINRRIDVALASGADGVQLGFDAAPPERARTLLGAGARIGVSTHAPAEVGAARGASHAQLAPIHAPLSKAAERPSLGLTALAAACAHGLPVLAQGGIQAGNARAAIDAGAAGVAVSGALARDPGPGARALREALEGPLP